MEPKLTKISPALAEKWLNLNPGNRRLREGVAEKYALDMKAGAWTECLDPIAFYEDGTLANGQHRLWAIVESDTTQSFLVVHGMTKEAGLNIDTGLGRSIVDNVRISGLDQGLSNEMVAVARFFVQGDRQKSQPPSNGMRLAMVQEYRLVLDWVISHGPTGRGFRNSTMLAAVARAFAAGVDPDRLEVFCRVYSTGFANGPEDAAAVALRNYVTARGRRIAVHEQRDFFWKAQNAISYFLRRRPLNVIKGVKEEAYPLKGAKPAKHEPAVKRVRGRPRKDAVGSRVAAR